MLLIVKGTNNLSQINMNSNLASPVKHQITPMKFETLQTG